MRKLMLLTLVAVFALSAGAAWAVVGVEDGYAGPSPGGSGGASGSSGSIGDPTTNWAQDKGAFSYVVYWDNDDDTWRVVSGSYDTPDLNIECDIELRIACSGDSGLYFHVGDTTAGVPPGYLNWTLQQNHPCWIGICKDDWVEADGDLPNGAATHLAYQADKWGNPPKAEDVSGDGKIPFDVYFYQAGGAEIATNYSLGAGSWGWWSPGRVNTGDNSGYFKIVLDVENYEADGYYNLDPMVLVAPEL